MRATALLTCASPTTLLAGCNCTHAATERRAAKGAGAPAAGLLLQGYGVQGRGSGSQDVRPIARASARQGQHHGCWHGRRCRGGGRNGVAGKRRSRFGVQQQLRG